MNQTWAVARQTIAEGVRMKLAIVFLVLIGMVVLGLPFSVAGDRSLAGAVQSFLSYALAATGVLLGLLTIFMSRSLSDEFVERQLFLIVTKPIPRWQFVLGKWVGIVLLNAVFLGFAGLTTYAMVKVLQRTHPPIDAQRDARELANEVLVARHAVRLTVPDFSKSAEAEFQRNLEEGVYAATPDLDLAVERARLERKHEARWRVVGPYEQRRFEFYSVLCDRSAGHELQLRYKTNISHYAPDEIFRGAWRFGNPAKGTPVYTVPVRHVIDRYHLVRFPADAVATDGTLDVFFANQNPFEGETQHRNVIEFRKGDDPEVLFVVGSFEGNFLRLLVLMLCKLMFLASVGLLTATVFSFPVACLASFTVYVLAAGRQFLTDALDWAINDSEGLWDSAHAFGMRMINFAYQATHWILPDFGYYDAVETLVNGRNVSLVWVLQGIGELVTVKGLLVLGLAMLLFHRREVAEVSV